MNLHSPRLTLQPLDLHHAQLVLALFNDPDFVRYVGDRGIRTPDQAAHYIESVAIATRRNTGITNYAVLRGDTGQPLGLCGLLLRPFLPAPDLGYGFLPAARGAGFAREAVQAVLSSAPRARLYAMVNPDNLPSRRLLEDFHFAPVDAAAQRDLELPYENTLLLCRHLDEANR